MLLKLIKKSSVERSLQLWFDSVRVLPNVRVWFCSLQLRKLEFGTLKACVKFCVIYVSFQNFLVYTQQGSCRIWVHRFDSVWVLRVFLLFTSSMVYYYTKIWTPAEWR